MARVPSSPRGGRVAIRLAPGVSPVAHGGGRQACAAFCAGLTARADEPPAAAMRVCWPSRGDGARRPITRTSPDSCRVRCTPPQAATLPTQWEAKTTKLRLTEASWCWILAKVQRCERRIRRTKGAIVVSSDQIWLPEQRYRDAAFVRLLGSGDGEFRLKTPEDGEMKAIVDGRDLGGELPPNFPTQVFLNRRTAAGHWMCRWLAPEQNPWTNDALPRVGDTVKGRVTRFVEDWLAKVEIEISGIPMEADLARDRLPGKPGSCIDRILEIGDFDHRLGR